MGCISFAGMKVWNCNCNIIKINHQTADHVTTIPTAKAISENFASANSNAGYLSSKLSAVRAKD